MGAPVDYSFASVNQTLFVKTAEHFKNSLAATLVKGETLSFPIAGGAHFFELFNNSAAVFFFPFPSTLEEAVSADIFLSQALFFHSFNNFCFGGD